MIYVFLYLGAAVLANVVISITGPIWWVVALVSAGMVGFDLTSRDKLHEYWHHKNLWVKMGALIFSGSLLSFLVSILSSGAISSSASLRVSTASFVAFAVAGIADALVYHLLFARAPLVKVNTSNVVSAVLDSLIFPTIAFGWPPPLLIVGIQFFSKVAGGFAWAYLLYRKNK
jgi:uncharacterized PurR-regulated membrane protein YhhQ (DUF165 family)